MFGNDSKTCRSKRGRTNVDGRDTCSLFLGSVVSKYDVDELDAVRKRCKESLVEVKRPDGTVAKSRGERTFYGAFSGGFSAGHYGTVGSKEGWTPSSFCSARQKRSLEPVRTAEDYMDEEDLREHRETHSTIKVRGMYEKPTSSVRDLVSPEVEDLFLRKRLGAKLLDATEDTASASGASEVKAKVRKGCAPNPNAHGLSHLTTRSLLRKTGLRSGGRSHEAKLERLWRCKRDLRGIGFLVDTSICGVSSANTAPSRRRLYMSGKSRDGDDYGTFGTGVFDERDVWEDIYNDRGGTAGVMDSVALVAVEGTLGHGGSQDFVDAQGQEEPQLESRWAAPRVPEDFRGIHVEIGTGISDEHRQLLDFLEKHGGGRLVHPDRRSELLGEQTREPPSPATASIPENTKPSVRDSCGPLWQGVSDETKGSLLHSLGSRNFVVGDDQDMDGVRGRHDPFHSDPEKQARYAQFCLALEGASSPSQFLRDGPLTDSEQKAELEEFGRVFRLFRQKNPNVDMKSALPSPAIPALRRHVQTWQPVLLLCKRWGVPDPKIAPASGTHVQRAYVAQVQLGLSKLHTEQAPIPAVSQWNVPDWQAPVVAPCPPKSLFEAIFGDSEGESLSAPS